MNKQILAKTHWNNPNGFHSRENNKSAVCIQLPFPNTQNKQKRHQRKVQTLNPFYFCFHRTAIRSLPPVHAQPPLCSLPGGLRARPEAQRTPRKDTGAITQTTKRTNKKAWALTPTAGARLQSQKKKMFEDVKAIWTVIKNTQILNKKTMEAERGFP